MSHTITASVPGLSPLEWNELVSRCLGKRDWACRILGKFQAQLDKDLEGLKQAIALNQIELVAQLAHRLKGACSNASAPILRDRSSDQETAARAEAVDLIHEAWQHLCHERDRFYESTAELRTSSK